MHVRYGFAALVLAASVVLVAFKPVSKPAEEVLRIQSHFDSVLVELAARDVSTLSGEQRARRAAISRTLTAYRDRGAFPHNYHFPEAPTPYFVDRKTGTLCAVAHLLESTGRRDIVDRVAAANNNVWVPQLAGDTAFEAWLDRSGLTLAEAARIQVPYVIEETVPAGRDDVVSMSAVAVMGGATALNLLTNRDGHGKLRNVVGLTSGIAGLGLGAVILADPQGFRGAAIANVAMGALSSFVSVRGFLQHRKHVAAQRDAERAKVAVAPLVPTSTSGAGVSVTVRF